MKKRKVISTFLGILLILSSFTLAYGEVPPDVADTQYEESVSAMMDLGIIDGYPDGTFKPSDPVSRAEMAKLIIAALELDDEAIEIYSSDLTDVNSHWAKGYVGYSNKLSIIEGYPDKTFMPEQDVSYYEVVTMLVRAIGYADLEGDWPENYETKAIELGILEDKLENGSDPAPRGDVSDLMYKIINLPIGEDPEDTILLRHTTPDMSYEAWQIPYGERLINEYGLEGAVTDSTPSIMDSQYWQIPDFYNLTTNDRLTILTNFKTTQQTNGWTCGPASSLMTLEWYDMRGDLNEMDLAHLRQNDEPGATTLEQMENIFEGLETTMDQEWDLYSTYDANLEWGEDGYPYLTYKGEKVNAFDWVPMVLAEGKPIIVGWNDWGGHYQVIIGYDTMGTEITADDVLILADPYDTTDHHQDGYLIQSAERLIWDWSAGWDPDFDYGIFLVASPEGMDEKELVLGEGLEDDPTNVGDFTDDHMIPYGEDLIDDIVTFNSEEPYSTDYPVWFGSDGLSGPASADVFRTADYPNSPYYKHLDVYDLESTETRTILENYKTIQQATEFTCGVTSMLGVLEWFDERGDLNEMDLAALRDKTDGLPGTTIEEMLNAAEMLEGDWNIKSTHDLVEGDSYFGLGIVEDEEYIDLGDMIPYYIEKGIPVMVMWHEWGGHYQTVIGYDDMGTEGTCDDVIILMDSYDTTDHNQDGYVIESYERLIYDWGNSYDADVDSFAFVVIYPEE